MGRQLYNFAVLLSTIVTLSTSAIINSPPHIIKQPPADELLFKVAQVSTETDKPFMVECEAEGHPEPTYRWIKNGKRFEWQAYDNRMLQQPGRGTIVVTSPRDEDVGQYQCFAENEFGVATSNSVFVRKAELNTFQEVTTRTVQAQEGSPFNLTCQPPDGWPKPIVNWLIQDDNGIKTINNSRMTVDPEGTLWFSNVTRDDQSEDFKYACSATSVFKNEYKIGDIVLLDVIQTGQSPGQNKHPPIRQYTTKKGEAGLRGKRVELFCIFGGTPLPSIRWSKDGQYVAYSDRITSGHYGKSLVIKHATFDDAGTYTCDVTNGVGTQQSYSFNLKIFAIPYFTKEPEIQNAAEEETVTFECQASGVPEPTIQWIFNGKPISEAERNPRRSVTTNKITIRDVLKKDTGNYGCNATNSLGYVYKDVYLNVLALPPEITEAPRKIVTVAGKTVILTCRVFGAPKPLVRWSHNGLELTGGRFRTLDVGDLQIQDVIFLDGGEYTCHASNKFGNQTATGSLDIKRATRITDPPQDYEVVVGQQVNFRCNAEKDDTLNLDIEWQKDSEPIDFDRDARFTKHNDNSLTITKAIELDSAMYTCVARTELDEVAAAATLRVQDVPNAPGDVKAECSNYIAKVTWRPMGDNRAPILFYIIQYNTPFTPDVWENAFDKVPGTTFDFRVDLSPYANYTFRVIAVNKVGPSPPSAPSTDSCETRPSVPYENPANVKGEGTEPTNLVISWSVMPQIEHNGPGFHYRVFWRRDIDGAQWEYRDVRWEENKLIIPDQPTYVRYLIKVVAMNDMGEANVAASEIVGYSGEDVPLEAPTNFTLGQVISSNSAILNWNPVNPESVRGNFKGYKVQTWTEEDGEAYYREIHLRGDATSALVTHFQPDCKNFARVLVYNGRYNGPSSAVIDFNTPEGKPSPVESIEAYPLGSSAFLLHWNKPSHPNGKLTGYRIYYEEVKKTEILAQKEREPHISDPRITHAKLGELSPGTKYRISITATTKAGEGTASFIEKATLPLGSREPDAPKFSWEQLPSDNGYASVKITWLPNVEGGRPGSHFFVKYRIQEETHWRQTKEEVNDDFLIVKGLVPDTVYEFRVVSVDGIYTKESDTIEIDTNGVEGPIKVPNENVANAGWFIGMMLALAFIILLFILICIIRRNRGGKYDVHDRELANGRRDYPEEGGFHEYSQPLDNKSTGRQSVSSGKPGPESDTDSMAEYGEGDTAQFAEDGSFIGQYFPGQLQAPASPQPIPHNQQQQPVSQGSNAVATYV